MFFGATSLPGAEVSNFYKWRGIVVNKLIGKTIKVSDYLFN